MGERCTTIGQQVVITVGERKIKAGPNRWTMTGRCWCGRSTVTWNGSLVATSCWRNENEECRMKKRLSISCFHSSLLMLHSSVAYDSLFDIGNTNTHVGWRTGGG